MLMITMECLQYIDHYHGVFTCCRLWSTYSMLTTMKCLQYQEQITESASVYITALKSLTDFFIGIFSLIMEVALTLAQQHSHQLI